jgi:hypothetical protein
MRNEELSIKPEGKRVLITSGSFAGNEGVCLGKSTERNKWAVSPDSSDEVLMLEFEKDFGLLVGLSGDPSKN